ncbi:acyltransferase family protein [Streptomyces gobiensis]|uniref:acyltransferase family protein n=1 Tax=Streptomyces gobiensis TaxID=2875706 RepID=UPI001E298BF9|nr:hypothetical protein [Streptomyces gobiensis]UGY94226.1 hypothetical protein test1122_22510 [Streptomyces gobiensis]
MRRIGNRARSKKSRDPHWDNIRYISGTLIIFGHLVEKMSEHDGLRWLYVASWAIRVPVFAMVAGYFSSAGPLDFREVRRLVESIAVPYILIGLLHTLQKWYLYGEWTIYHANPAWATWFLLSLILWRMALPYLAALRWPLLLSVGAALAVGYLDRFGSTFSAARTVTFLPFFLLGWQLRQGLAEKLLYARWSRNAAVGVLFLTFVLGWVVRHDVTNDWLWMRGPYGDDLPGGMEWAWVVRACLLAVGMVAGLSFIRLMPKCRIPLVTYLGAGGMYIYLLHPLVVRPFKLNGGVDWVGPWYEQLALIPLAVLISAVLASAPVRKLTWPVIQPRLPWLFAPAPQPTATRQPPPPRRPADPDQTAASVERDRVPSVG